mgnify:CR=1 FL=1
MLIPKVDSGANVFDIVLPKNGDSTVSYLLIVSGDCSGDYNEPGPDLFGNCYATFIYCTIGVVPA